MNILTSYSFCLILNATPIPLLVFQLYINWCEKFLSKTRSLNIASLSLGLSIQEQFVAIVRLLEYENFSRC